MSDITDTIPDSSSDDDGYFSDRSSTFGDRVAAGRRAVGLTQQALARNLGIKLKTLRAWEDDMSEPRANKLQMLAGVLGVSLIWLLTGSGDGVDDPTVAPDGVIAVNANTASGLLADLRAVRADHAALGQKLARLEAQMQAAQLV